MGLIKEPLNVDFLIAPKNVSKKHLEELDQLIAKLKSKKKSIYKNKMPKRKQAA